VPISDEEYNQIKAKLRKRSKIFLTVGILVFLVGIILIILSFVFSDFGFNSALMFPAFFVLFIGSSLSVIGFYLWYVTKMDKISGYFSKATGDSASYTTNKITDGFATGLEKHGMGIGSKEVIKVRCRNCEYLETEDAEFCSKCGKAI
jgi:hypothetical protein